MVLEDQYRNAQEELKEKQTSLKQNRPSPAAMKADQLEIKRLENQLDKFLVTQIKSELSNKALYTNNFVFSLLFYKSSIFLLQ